MATPSSPLAIPSTIDTVALNTSLADYSNTLTDNVYNANVYLRLANQNKKTIDGGMSIVEPLIEAQQNAGGFYLGADVLNNSVPNTLTMVEYRWQNAYEPIQITRDEERQNSGEMHKILGLVATKTTLSEKAISKRLEQGLTTPVGEANNLIDIETLVNTGTLGSIAGGTDTFWQATVTTSGAFATQGLTDMTTATYAVASASDQDLPTHYITTKVIYQKFENTRLPVERITNTMAANAGFTSLTYKGKPFMYINYCATGLIFGLNMGYNYLAVDSATDMITTPFVAPTNQTVKVAYILWRGNQITNNRRRNFKLDSVT